MSERLNILIVNSSISIPESEWDWTFACSGGPGGQNVNKVASKAVLRWQFQESSSVPLYVKERFKRLNAKRITVEGEVVISSQLYRDQLRNRQNCLDKLGELLREAAEIPKLRRTTRPTKASQRRRLADKRHVSETKSIRRNQSGED